MVDAGWETYACQLCAAVTAFRCSALLLDVQISELAAWGLDHADLVGDGVVRLPPALQQIQWSAFRPSHLASSIETIGYWSRAYVGESVGGHLNGCKVVCAVV